MKRTEIYQELRNNPKNVRYEKICRVVELFGFVFTRQKGSHRIYKRQGIKELLDFQNVQGKVKSYQVKQFLKVVEDYNLLEE